MPKKNLLISAALTAFVLVTLTGVVSAYKQVTSNFNLVQASPTAAPTIEPVAVILPTATVPVILTHQEAALVAANHLEQTDLYSVEIALWEDIEEAFKVVFSTGDIVYVSMGGQILGTEEPPIVVITETKNNNGNNQSSNNNHDDDDHDDYEEDERDEEDEEDEKDDD